MSVFTRRLSLRGSGRALKALAIAIPLALTASAAMADSFGFYYGSGPYYRPYHHHYFHPRRVVVVAPFYYPPPPPRTVVVQQAVPYTPTCTNGQWRQIDGSIVNGVACLQPNGTWQLQ